jgi:hypothetical protein
LSGPAKILKRLYKEAAEKGFKDPVLVYIPEMEMVHIY